MFLGVGSLRDSYKFKSTLFKVDKKKPQESHPGYSESFSAQTKLAINPKTDEIVILNPPSPSLLFLKRDGTFIKSLLVGKYEQLNIILIHPSTGDIYLGDSSRHRIRVLKPDGRKASPEYLDLQGGTRSTGWFAPHKLCWTHTGNLAILGSHNYTMKIQIWTTEGQFRSECPTGPGQARDFCVDSHGNYLVLKKDDKDGKKSIVHLSPKGKLLNEIHPSPSKDYLWNPRLVLRDKIGCLLVVENMAKDEPLIPYSCRLVLFGPEGTCLKALDPLVPKHKESKAHGPICIAIDPQGNLVTIEKSTLAVTLWT